MDITHLTPDAEGSIEWPSFSNDKKAVVTLGVWWNSRTSMMLFPW